MCLAEQCLYMPEEQKYLKQMTKQVYVRVTNSCWDESVLHSLSLSVSISDLCLAVINVMDLFIS